LEAIADGGERGDGAKLRKDVAPGVIRPAGGDGVLRIGVAPHRALDVGKRVVRLAADLHRKKFVNALAPYVGSQNVAVPVDVGKALPAVVVDVANHTIPRRRDAGVPAFTRRRGEPVADARPATGMTARWNTTHAHDGGIIAKNIGMRT